ncbi:MAG: putative signal transducing protein [Thermanaerothrix sp.]|uniref:putative signal transducing protein n=1 Tax=Thermanaerothrix sp. TaxID=2972675 RepID=UPI003C7BFEFF
MPPNPPGYEEVYRANGRLHADIIRGFLEAAGFTVVLYQESAGAVYGLTVGPLGEVRIFVPSAQAAEARALLAAMDRGETNASEEDEVDLDETPSDPASPR